MLDDLQLKYTPYSGSLGSTRQFNLKLNIGCGNDTDGDVRLNITPTDTSNIIADAHYLPLRAAFNEIKCFNVMEHLPSPIRALEEMRRVCETGFISIQVPNLLELRRFLSTIKNPLRRVKKDTNHLQGWDATEMKHLIRSVGGIRILSITWKGEGKKEKFNWLNGILKRVLPPSLYYKEMLVNLASICPNANKCVYYSDDGVICNEGDYGFCPVKSGVFWVKESSIYDHSVFDGQIIEDDHASIIDT